MPDDPEDAYKVGFRRPPKHTRFEKGRSGNPGGRPPSKKTGRTDISELLDGPVEVKVGGKVRTMQASEASFRQLAKKALGGDLRAMVRFVKLCEEYGVVAPPPADLGSGVIRAPKNVDFYEWLDSVTELVPACED